MLAPLPDLVARAIPVRRRTGRPYVSRAAVRMIAAPHPVGRARSWTRRLCQRWQVPDVAAADAALCVSELVTNAVRHTGSRHVQMSALVESGQLAVSVIQQERPVVPVKAKEVGPDQADGRGLFLIGTLADSWGTQDLPSGRHAVWFRPTWPAHSTKATTP